MRRAQQLFGFERGTTDWRKVLEDPEVEAVNITAPNRLHRPIAEAAAAAGKHVFCEKPVGCSPQDTAAIAAAARRAGVMSFTGYCYRWAPLVQHAHELIVAGRLGTLTHYRGRFFVGYGSNPHSVLSWRFQRDQAGMGTLADLMSHVADMAHLMAGPVRRIAAAQETFIKQRPLATEGEGTHFTIRKDGPMGDMTNEDYVGALVEFENGARGTFEACRVIVGPQCEMAFEVHGTKGALRWDFQRMNELELCLADEGGANDGYVRLFSGPEHPFHAQFNPGPAVGLGYEDLMTIQMHQFLKSIADGQPIAPGFEEAWAVANVQDAVQRSWQSGQWEAVGKGA